jgi:hypothetical protein
VAYEAIPGKLTDSGIYTFARTVAYQTANVYAIRMAAVFMMSTRTLAIRIGIFPRWMAYFGFPLALLLLLSLGRLKGRLKSWVQALHSHAGQWECVRYIWNNRHRMRYPKFHKQVLCTLTGVVEAGCKVVVGTRLKRAGMLKGTCSQFTLCPSKRPSLLCP